MQKLRIFGSIVIVLIVTAFLTTPFFFKIVPSINWVVWGMIGMLIVAIVANVLEYFYIKTPDTVNVLLAATLLILSIYIFTFGTQYLILGVNIPLSFWHRVSFYTLPAISFESGVITLANICIMRMPQREKIRNEIIIGAYAVIVMVINFLSVLHLITVQIHIIISQIIISLLSLFICGLFFPKFTSQKIFNKKHP